MIWPLTVFGYYTDAAGTITTVLPRSPAAKAGLHAGDRVDVRDFKPADRKPGLIGRTFSAYNPVRHLTIVRDGVTAGRGHRHSRTVGDADRHLVARVRGVRCHRHRFVWQSCVANRASLGFFHFVVGGSYPDAMISIWLDYPWRMIVDIINDVLVSGSLMASSCSRSAIRAIFPCVGACRPTGSRPSCGRLVRYSTSTPTSSRPILRARRCSRIRPTGSFRPFSRSLPSCRSSVR